MNNKNLLRIYYKNQRKLFSSEVSNIKLNLLLFDFLKDSFLTHIIGAYYPYSYEANIVSTLDKLLDCSAILALPRIEDNIINFYQYTKFIPLIANQFNILEPSPLTPLSPSVILTPLIAADLNGNRLGYGKGHYDQYFSKNSTKIIKIGICYEAQIAEHIPKESHDITLDYLVTEKNIYSCNKFNSR